MLKTIGNVTVLLLAACGGSPAKVVTERPPPSPSLPSPPPEEPRVAARHQAIVASMFGSCALSKGSVYCWGQGSRSDPQRPKRIPELDGVVAIDAGLPVNGLLPDGRVLGGDPVEPLASGATTFASHAEHLCTLDAKGTPSCTFRGDPLEPKHLAGFGKLAEIAVTSDRVCGAGFDGAVRCLGTSDGGTFDANGLFLWPESPALHGLVGGSKLACGVGAQRLVCHGFSFEGSWPKAPAIVAPASHRVCWVDADRVRCVVASGAETSTQLSDVTHLACTDEHCCARQSGGRVFCWGSRQGGVLGDGVPSSFHDQPRVVALGKKALGLRANLCASVDDGLRCWGTIGVPRWSPIDPAVVSGPPGPKDSYVDASEGCALRQSGRLVCARPDQSIELQGVAAFAPVRGGVCAVGTNKKVRCQAYSDPAPSDVPSLTGSVEIAAMRDWVCGRKANGTLTCDGPADGSAFGGEPFPTTGIDGLTNLDAALCVHRKQDGWTCYEHQKKRLRTFPTAKQVAHTHDDFVWLDEKGVSGPLPHGNGSYGVYPFPSVPTAITGGSGAVCGLMGDGRVLCLGDATEGGMGDGFDYGPTGPVAVALP